MTVVQELEEKKGELEASAVKIAELEASIVSLNEESSKAIEALNMEAAEAKKHLDASVAECAELKSQIDVKDAKLAEIEEDLNKAKAALANPAFAAAAVSGSEKSVEEGRSEAKARMTKEEALAEYKNISDAKERAEFRKAHKEELGL